MGYNEDRVLRRYSAARIKGKLRHKLSANQRFERALAKMPGEDPVLPVVMHSLERYLIGAPHPSEIDEAVQRAITRSGLGREIVEKLVNYWKSLPEDKKAEFVPAELLSLRPEQRLETEIFRSTLKRSVRSVQTVGITPARWANVVLSHVIVQPVQRAKPARFLALPTPANVTGISPTDPDGFPYIYFGGNFTIYGNGFSLNNADNLIYIENLADPSINRTITPNVSTSDKLQATAPIDIVEGVYAVLVARTPNYVKAYFHPAIGPAPTINTLSPASQFPEKKVIVTGNGFSEDPRVIWKSLEPDVTETDWFVDNCLLLSPTQVEMTVPDWMTPGEYAVSFACKNTKTSDWKTFTVRPFKFEVDFMKITCVDESNPEWWGSDEIVTRWVIVADDTAWEKSTGEYSGFDDGTIKLYNSTDRTVFMPGAGPAIVNKYLYISTALWEWDLGDAEAADKVLGFIGDLAPAIGSAFGPLGSTIGTVIGYILKALGKIISWLGGDPDSLGVKDLTWTYENLRMNTKNAQKKFTGTLDFFNDADTGSYTLDYTVSRVEQ